MATAPPAAPTQPSWEPAGVQALQGGRDHPDPRGLRESADLARPERGEGGGRKPSDALTRQALIDAAYMDTCDDATGDAVDLRSSNILEDTSTAEFAFSGTACHAWPNSALGGQGSFQWLLDTPGGRVGHDYVVFIFEDFDGEMSVLVFRTPSDDPNTWIDTWYDFAFRFDDDHSVIGFVPDHALGSPTSFDFLAASVGATGGEDLLPELHEFLLTYPDSCMVSVSRQATVKAIPGRYAAALAAVESKGLQIGAEADELGLFDVTVDDPSTLNQLRQLPGVAEVTPAVAMTKFRIPNDPGYPQQWALPRIGAPAAWDTTTGSGLAIAIIDDGIDATRPDLAGRVLAGHDTAFDVPLPAGANSDRGGHGTAIAGVAAATGDNARELAGLDWTASIVPYRVFDAAGCATATAVADAIVRAADRGVAVINLSIGTATRAPQLEAAVAYARDRDVTIVAASGNDGDGGNAVNYPAALHDVISVGATTANDVLAGYSNTASSIDLVAPGGDGSGTAARDVLLLGERDALVPGAGTSVAAPFVAAAAALYRGHYPAATRGLVESSLSRSAHDLGPPGFDTAHGWGRLDVAAMLAVPPFENPPAADAIETSTLRSTPVDITLTATDPKDRPLTYSVVDAPDHGTLSGSAPHLTYTPTIGFAGTDRFTFRATNPDLESDDATVTIHVRDRDAIRRFGQDRFATAVDISKNAFSPDVPVAYIATGTNFPDALAGSAAAGKEGGPILLVSDSIPTVTATELRRLRPGRIVVLGGTGVVSTPIELALADFTTGTVTRLAGQNRFETNAKISNEVFDHADTVFVATGANFPDALSAAPVAIGHSAPILLVNKTAIPEPVAAELQRLAPDRIVILGGTGVVAPEVATQLTAYAGDVERWSGENRFKTAVDVSNHAFAPPAGFGTVYVATGGNFPDALAGGVVAGLGGAPVLLVPTRGTVDPAVLDEIRRLRAETIVVFGGEAAVTGSVVAQLTGA